MEFNEKYVARYEAWFDSPAGAFAFRAEKRLVNTLIAGWPRRAQRLLEVGCGPGRFLEVFWETGFDVSGLDASPAMLKAARTRMEHRADLHLGRAEHLPFDDKEYDYVVMLSVLEFCDDPEEALREAARVARKGLLIGYLNRRSLYYLARGRVWPWTRRRTSLHEARWFSSCELASLAQSACNRRPDRTASVLFGPVATWSARQPWKFLNSRVVPAGIGAFAASRFNLLGDPGMTPLFALKNPPGARAAGGPA